MTDRDHFAAAALTGLCSMPPMSGPDKPHDFAAMAYAYADAMLRERSRSGQNSSGGTDSAAKCTERDSANHDAAPAARASEATASPERVRVRGDAGTGDTTEPVAWGVASRTGLLATSISRIDAVDMQSEYERDTAVVPLYRSPTLTDAEREAVAYYIGTGGPDRVDAALRGLLERLTKARG